MADSAELLRFDTVEGKAWMRKFQAELEQLRVQLESPELDERQTQVLRGRIFQVNEFLKLPRILQQEHAAKMQLGGAATKNRAIFSSAEVPMDSY